MTNSCSHCVDLLVVIAGRKQKTALLEALSGAGGRLITVVYGKGSVRAGYLKDILGFVPEENKVVMTCLLPCGKTDAVFRMLADEFHFDRPNTGIAFTIPVETMSI